MYVLLAGHYGTVYYACFVVHDRTLQQEIKVSSLFLCK